MNAHATPDHERPYEALKRLGLRLPQAPVGPSAYVPVNALDGVLYVSGLLPLDDDGRLPRRGLVGADVDPVAAAMLASRCALHLLGRLADELGTLGAVRSVLKLTVYVASAPGFQGQSTVADGASRLVTTVLGPAGVHARSAIGVAALPLGSPVELDAVVAGSGPP